jgi:threonylcarbamoyladenosine tRNA methylthiotransferase MtaB
VSESTKKKRNEMLRLLGNEKNYSFRQKMLGRELNVVVEGRTDASMGMLSGLTDNYIRVIIDNIDDGHIGRQVPVRITKVDIKSTISRAL